MRMSAVLVSFLILQVAGFSGTIYVPDDHTTIQAAIDAAASGDTILVRAGTYHENIDFKAKGISVIGEGGAAATSIDGNQAGSVVTFQSGEGPASVLDGFTITNGRSVYGGGGIYCFLYSSPTLRNNIITGNVADFNGGGIACEDHSSPTLSSNILTGNSALFDGGGISCWSSCSPQIVNNTVTGNSAARNGGGVCCMNSDSLTMVNSIVWENSDQGGYEIWVGSSPSPSTFTISYSDVKGGQSAVKVEAGCVLSWNAGMIDADPLFIDAAAGDYHIPFDSPCRSAGDRNAPGLPDTDFEGDPRTGLFAFPDMGADEFHTHFYVTGPVTSGASGTGIIIGWPKTNPVMLISGSGVLPAPDPTPYGDFWLMPPWDHRIHFISIPDNGVKKISRILSTTLPPGTTIPVQALVGTELSNLWIITIE